MHEAWEIKRGLSDVMSNKVIDDIYDLGINNGALGGKLLVLVAEDLYYLCAKKICVKN